MCKYCDGSWPIASDDDLYIDTHDQTLCYEDEYNCTISTHISFCPWCGRPLNTDETNDLYFVANCQDDSVYDMEMIDTEEDAKRIATRGLEPNESKYLYTYRLVRTQRVFLPSGCIFEDVE